MRAFIADFSMYMSGRGPATATDPSGVGPLQTIISGKQEQSHVLVVHNGEPSQLPPTLTESKDKLNCTIFESDLRVVGPPILQFTQSILLLILLADDR